MKKQLLWTLLLLSSLTAKASNFYPEQDVKIETLEQEVHNVTFNNDSNLKTSMDGSNIATLTINNNLSAGYDIYATAANGKLVTPTQKQYIYYTLSCTSFLTDSGGFTVPAATNITLAPNVPTLVYHIENPSNTTVEAEATCDLIPSSGQNINALLEGDYTDSIVFSMK